MPNLIANDIVSVQPLDRRTGQVFFLKFKYGNTKGEITQGDDMLHPNSGYAGKDYSGEKIEGEIVAASGATNISYTLPYTPIQPGTIKITDGVNTITDVDNGDGTGYFTGSLLATTPTNNTINYTTGAINVDIQAAIADVTAEWEYDLNDPNATVVEVDVTVEAQPVIARPRKLKSIYMFDTAYDLKMAFGLDMDTVILKATSGEIGFEIDNEIMQDLLNIAGATAVTWNLNPEYQGMDVKPHRLTIIDAINEASNNILAATKRYEGTFIICGKTGATVIESLGKDHYERIASGTVGGPHLAGILEGRYKVYKNPNYPDNVILVGAKGQMFIEAGYIYAPYLPVFATQLIVDENLKAKRGFATVYAKKVVNPNMYCKITIVNNTPA